MLKRFIPVLVVLAVAALLVLTSLFTVQETQVAIRTEFGAIVGIDYDPGLHWKWPWDQVVKFERRILSQSYEGETFLTNDNRGLIVDFYVKWRVNDASRFFQATGGEEDIAAQRLAEIVKDGIKSVVAQRDAHRVEQFHDHEHEEGLVEDVDDHVVDVVDVEVPRDVQPGAEHQEAAAADQEKGDDRVDGVLDHLEHHQPDTVPRRAPQRVHRGRVRRRWLIRHGPRGTW